MRYFRAEPKYTTVRTVDGETLIEDSLRALEEEFAGRFVRVHRNVLAAIDHIDGLGKLNSGRVVLKLRGIPDRLEVSRRHLPDPRGHIKGLGKADR